jgi:DNA topoisomerase-2
MSKQRIAKQIDMRTHILTKPMWAGSQKVQTIMSPVLSYDAEYDASIFEMKNLAYPPALFKIIDEGVVNAIDHCNHYPKLVNKIKISIDQTGRITIYNNGPGIPIIETENIKGTKMYMPQLIASEFLAGDNLDDSGDNTKGGTNGIGLKLIAGFSTELTLTTVDENTGLKFVQTYANRLLDVQPAIITPCKEKPYTQISFMPVYSEFKLSFEKFQPVLTKLLEARSWQAAAYCAASVYYNDSLIPITSFSEFCQMFTKNSVLSLTMKQPNGKHDWDVCIAVSDGKEQQISLINGVFMSKGGTHIQHIQKRVIEHLRPRVEKEIKKSQVKFNKNYITNNVMIFMKGAIPSPDFLSQTKEAISDPIEKFKDYDFTERDWLRVWELLKNAILESFLKKQLGDVKTRVNRNKVDAPKYTEARNCKLKDSTRLECGLIVTEGDSATGTANLGLLSKASPNFNYDWFGTFSIGGVPINGFKESLEIKVKDDSDVKYSKVIKRVINAENTKPAELTKPTEKTVVRKAAPRKAADDIYISKRIPNNKVMNNERISSLVKVLGLDYNKSYRLTEIGDKEWLTLRYGFIVGLTDQDLDGFNIYGLLATYIMTYWPALVQRQFLRRINTPVIRALPKNKKNFVKEFYTEKDYKIWYDSLSLKQRNGYVVKYYKGLGSHNAQRKEVFQMFKNIDEKIKVYEFDPDAMKNMLIYYGKDTKPRKEALADPFIADESPGLLVPLSEHFTIQTKAYQRDNIVRKLLSMIDGFVSSRRKVFFTARKNGHNTIKVQGLAGKVVADADYHHGEASLEQTIIRMAQAFPMARNLPLLIPDGMFGTRAMGYKNAAGSRYIYTKINHKLADKLFRKEDDYILEYENSDGVQLEPKYYVPIIPYVLCEDNQLPATGWKISIYARKIDSIFDNVRKMILGEIKECGRLPPWRKDFKGSIKLYKGKYYYIGAYDYDADENILTITELPPGMYSNAYLKGTDDDKISRRGEKRGMQTSEWITDYDDYTDTDGVNIKFTLKPGAYEDITSDDSKYGDEDLDPIVDCFKLMEPIHHLINLVNEEHRVIEYPTYEAVFNDWYVFRKRLYAIRVEREIILTDLRIKMLQNIQRFSTQHDSFNITKNTKEETTIAILKENGYDIFNHRLLENPQFTNVKELVKLITEEEHGANYEYLLLIQYRELQEGPYKKREEKIKELLERMEYLTTDMGLFVGAKIWLHELDELVKAVAEGINSGWKYGEDEYRFEE